MLKKKADPSQVNAKGKTPLDLAQTSQSPAVVKLLEKFGATRNCSSETDRRVMRCLRVGPSEEVEPRPVSPDPRVRGRIYLSFCFFTLRSLSGGNPEIT